MSRGNATRSIREARFIDIPLMVRAPALAPPAAPSHTPAGTQLLLGDARLMQPKPTAATQSSAAVVPPSAAPKGKKLLFTKTQQGWLNLKFIEQRWWNKIADDTSFSVPSSWVFRDLWIPEADAANIIYAPMTKDAPSQLIDQMMQFCRPLCKTLV